MIDKHDERELEILDRYRYRLQDLERWYAQQLGILARDKQEALAALSHQGQAGPDMDTILGLPGVVMPKLIKTKWGVLFA